MQRKKFVSKRQEATSSIDVAINVIGGKWKMLILVALMKGPQRTSSLQKALPHISERLLIRQLRELERHLLITRKVYPSVPPKVEYTVTEYGMTLQPVIFQLSAWGYEHAKKIYAMGKIEYRVEQFGN